MIEDMLRDIAKAEPQLNIAILRYFNPVGAHKSGLIGEDPNGIPNNLMPYITKVAIGELKELRVFGNDYPTHDGTGVRDYIHVVDLSVGHVKAPIVTQRAVYVRTIDGKLQDGDPFSLHHFRALRQRGADPLEREGIHRLRLPKLSHKQGIYNSA